MAWAGGNRRLPIDAESSREQGGVVYDWDNVYEEKYDDNFRINTRITYRLDGSNFNQEWALDLQNLTDQEKSNSKDFSKKQKYFFYSRNILLFF